jgi:nitrogen-specific signal transduction histidine kinase
MTTNPFAFPRGADQKLTRGKQRYSRLFTVGGRTVNHGIDRFNVTQLIGGVATLIGSRIVEGVRFETAIDQAMPPMKRDSNRIRQILLKFRRAVFSW